MCDLERIGQLLEAWRILLHASGDCQLKPDEVLKWHKGILEHIEGTAEQDEPLPEHDSSNLLSDETADKTDEQLKRTLATAKHAKEIQTKPAPGSAERQTTAKLTADDEKTSCKWDAGNTTHDFNSRATGQSF
jgi:hypothetical protein